MSTDRRQAQILGLLFLVATGAYLAGQAIHGPILGAPDYLETAYPERFRVLAGLLVEFVRVMAIPLIGIFFFPVLKPHSRPSAYGYLVLRVLEASAQVFVLINMLALVNASAEYLGATSPDAEAWVTFGNRMQNSGEIAFRVSATLFFPLGALLLNAVLLRGRLVPRVIAGWGFLGAALLLGGSALHLAGVFAGVPEGLLEAALTGPIAIQEIVLAAWLILKGFYREGVAAAAPA